MGLGATYRIERAERGVRLRRGSRRLADARADAVHAPRVGARQPSGAADPSRPGLHAYHPWRAARRRRTRTDDLRGLGVSRRRARSGRQPLQHREAGAELVGGARRLASRAVAGAILRRTPAQPRMVRAVRSDADHRIGRIRRRGRLAAARRHARLGTSSARTTASTITRTAICSNGISARPAGRACTAARRCRRSRSSAWDCIPSGFNHPHVYSHIDPLTLGLVQRHCARSDAAGSALARTSPCIACRRTCFRTSTARDRFTCSSDGAHHARRWLTFTDARARSPRYNGFDIEMPPLGDTGPCQSSLCPNCSAPPCATPPAPSADGCARSRSRRRTIRPASRS